jgi:hypothetical protein
MLTYAHTAGASGAQPPKAFASTVAATASSSSALPDAAALGGGMFSFGGGGGLFSCKKLAGPPDAAAFLARNSDLVGGSLADMFKVCKVLQQASFTAFLRRMLGLFCHTELLRVPQLIHRICRIH